MIEVAKAQLQMARESGSGRSAATVFRGETLSQTVLALTAGTALGEHENPGEATVQVLTGEVEVTAGEQTWQVQVGQLLVLPPERHSLRAIEDSAVLLTVARG